MQFAAICAAAFIVNAAQMVRLSQSLRLGS
jgi:hypothetical protein